MSLDAKLAVQDGVATITVAGELDAESAPRFNDLIVAASSAGIHRLVVNLDGLTYLSSAGIRCLALAHQRLGTDVPVLVVGAVGGVAETIRLTGLGQSITVLGRSET